MSGLIALFSTKKENITDPLTYGLFALQHRGENGCGVAFVKHGIRTKKRHSLVGNLFTEKRDEKTFYEFLHEIEPYAAVGHTLYEKNSGLQPVEKENDNYHIALVMDGAFLGYDKPNDVVLAENFLALLSDTKDEVKAAAGVMEKIDDKGFYNCAVLVQNKDIVKLVAFRDPRGGKPFSLGKRDGCYIVASETQGLDGAGALFVEDIKPGSVYVFDENGYKQHRLIEKKHAHCIFDYIYFASPNSVIEGKNILEVRKELGKKLFARYGYKPDAVCPSPDSGRGCGIGYSEASGIALREWITKNPGAPRTFQLEDEISRKLAALSKFNVNLAVKGKKIGVPEDSIVRGTVIKLGIADKMKKRGATEVAVLVSYAPILFRCYRSDGKETMAAAGLESFDVKAIGTEVAKRIGVDKVFYNSIDDVVECCGKRDGKHDFCTACATGDYFFINRNFLRFNT